MKLLTKLNIRYIVFSMVVFAISGVAIYFILSVIITRQMDEQLLGSVQQTETLLNSNSRTELLKPFAEISKIQKRPETTIFADTLIFNERENELEEFRQISSVKNINGEYFQIVIRKSKIESEDLLETLAIITILAMLLLTSVLIIVNRGIAKSVWQPFYTNLKTIEKFSIRDKKPVNLKQTGIAEFEKLNLVLVKLTSQIMADYQNLKQFTEDASHEIQTPLAIIRSKLETLINDPEISEKQAETVNAIFTSVNRLARLNKSLVLLAKLDNNQFPETSEISIQKLIHEKAGEWNELLELKKIKLTTLFSTDIHLKINPFLAEILISNLFSNAINHNVFGGELKIRMEKNILKISNSGEKALENPQAVFTRFYKENTSSKSVGLGLAIVKKICDTNGISIQYSFEEKMHSFILAFPL